MRVNGYPEENHPCPPDDDRPAFKNIKVTDKGACFKGKRIEEAINDYLNFSARFDLFLIRQAWNRGVSFEDLADGFGPGAGTHGDWSGIRDSSDQAIDAMLERSLNYLFPAWV